MCPSQSATPRQSTGVAPEAMRCAGPGPGDPLPSARARPQSARPRPRSAMPRPPSASVGPAPAPAPVPQPDDAPAPTGARDPPTPAPAAPALPCPADAAPKPRGPGAAPAVRAPVRPDTRAGEAPEARAHARASPALHSPLSWVSALGSGTEGVPKRLRATAGHLHVAMAYDRLELTLQERVCAPEGPLPQRAAVGEFGGGGGGVRRRHPLRPGPSPPSNAEHGAAGGQASARGAVAVSGKNSHFPIGECVGLSFTKGTVGEDLRTPGQWGNGTVKNGYFVPSSSRFPPVFLPFLSHFPQPHPATSLQTPHPMCYAPLSPSFQTPKSGFGGPVSSVVLSTCARGARVCPFFRDPPHVGVGHGPVKRPEPAALASLAPCGGPAMRGHWGYASGPPHPSAGASPVVALLPTLCPRRFVQPPAGTPGEVVQVEHLGLTHTETQRDMWGTT